MSSETLDAATPATGGSEEQRLARRAGRRSPTVPALPVRLSVNKTYKLFIGGAFPRSESGRTYPVRGQDGTLLANAAMASRKDARDAVTKARSAFPKWSGASAYNRGQVLYRVAELLEGRRDQFAAEVATAEGLGREQAAAAVDAAIDRWVHHAGWTDKLAQVAGSANPVAGPFFNLSNVEPSGVVAVLAPQDSSLLGLVSVLAPPLSAGCTVVLLASEDRPLPAITLTEVLATSDVPAGEHVHRPGRTAEVAPWLASHRDVDAIDLAGAGAELAVRCQVEAADNLKRVRAPRPEDWTAVPGPARALDFCEVKTVWHPVGL
jgi:acyl-CoA reductase-like NAD-dependent aldehyde dehydrogenase